MIEIKSKREIHLMEEAGSLLAHVFDELEPHIRPGVSTLTLSLLAEKIISEGGGVAAEKGYAGYPAAICASVNEVLVHGIPSAKTILKDGDVVSLDIVVKKNGYHADACRTYLVGIGNEEKEKFIAVTRQAFFEGLKMVKEGNHLGDVSAAIQSYVEGHGYSLTREFSGHGIGREMHEDPSILNVGEKGTGPLLKEGMALAIEPMVLMGSPAVRTLKDGWTTVSKDGKITAHYENTVIVTKDGANVITLQDKERKVHE